MSVCTAKAHGILTLTLSNPKRANALTEAMCSQLFAALDSAEKDDEIRVVVLTGDGMFFSAGMDLSTASSGAAAPFDTALNLFTRIAEFPKPTIGKINGPALGGGVGLLFVTDIRIAVDNAFVQLAEVKRGLIPAIISLFIVPQLGPCLSKQYFLTGEKVPIQKLLQAGCITACVPGDKLDAVVADFAAVLLDGGPQAQSTIKQLVRVVDGTDSKEGKTLFVKGVFEGMMKSKEAAYGMKAFLDKKKPDWLAYLGKPSAKL